MRNSFLFGYRKLLSCVGCHVSRTTRKRATHVAPVIAHIESLESRALLTVTFHGGALLNAVEAQAVFLGSDWSTSATLQSQKGQLDQYVSTLVSGSYLEMLTTAGYNVGRGTASVGVVKNEPLSKTGNVGVTDGQIQGYLQSMISAGQLQTPDANRLYVVYVEPGVVVHLGGDASNTTFLGYHGAFSGTTASKQSVDIHYAVMAYPSAPNFTAQSQGFATNFDELTSVTSHEVAEAVTDPNVNYKALGWYDDQKNGEIGDLAEGFQSTITGATGIVYVVQDAVDQNDRLISPQTPPPPPTLTSPKLSVTVRSPTTAQLSWNAVAGSDGYRVYLVDGSSSTLVGTFGAKETGALVKNLTPGSKVSFKVEAFNSTSVAASSIVTVTMSNNPQPLTPPVVTVKILSSTVASLSWNSIPGATGYRIYWMDGNRRVLLGTVESTVKGVKIVGLHPGSKAKFIVEAFNSTSIADSQLVSVVTPTKHAFSFWS